MASFAQEEDPDKPSFLKGWRKEIFGEKALALREGKLLACYKDRKIQFLKAVK